MLQDPNWMKNKAAAGLAMPTYAYALNNPLRYTDPDGRDVICFRLGIYLWGCSHVRNKSAWDNIKDLFSFDEGFMGVPQWNCDGTMARKIKDNDWWDPKKFQRVETTFDKAVEKNLTPTDDFLRSLPPPNGIY